MRNDRALLTLIIVASTSLMLTDWEKENRVWLSLKLFVHRKMAKIFYIIKRGKETIMIFCCYLIKCTLKTSACSVKLFLLLLRHTGVDRNLGSPDYVAILMIRWKTRQNIFSTILNDPFPIKIWHWSKITHNQSNHIKSYIQKNYKSTHSFAYKGDLKGNPAVQNR